MHAQRKLKPILITTDSLYDGRCFNEDIILIGVIKMRMSNHPHLYRSEQMFRCLHAERAFGIKKPGAVVIVGGLIKKDPAQ